MRIGIIGSVALCIAFANLAQAAMEPDVNMTAENGAMEAVVGIKGTFDGLIKDGKAAKIMPYDEQSAQTAAEQKAEEGTMPTWAKWTIGGLVGVAVGAETYAYSKDKWWHAKDEKQAAPPMPQPLPNITVVTRDFSPVDMDITIINGNDNMNGTGRDSSSAAKRIAYSQGWRP